MDTVLVALLSFFGFILAYRTYGRWLARKVFRLDPEGLVPSREFNDGVDFVPTSREIVFGHHFTSIAGTGPIVGPAIAVFWGWLPALLWVVFGSIFIGAVHDFGSLVVSLRNRGRTVGELAGVLITPRARLLFLVILVFALTVVLGIFGLVIALIFSLYPETVLSVWIELPIALAIGFWVHRRQGSLLVPSILALTTMYLFIGVGCYLFPVDLTALLGIPLMSDTLANAVVAWTVILFVYCFFASVLPVWMLLQPRDYINSHQLIIALGLLVAGLVVAGVTGQASLAETAPAIATTIPADAPPIWPFLFITIACGACSGFHCLVSSGTSSKQLARETDAQAVGYGAMLLEGALAVLVILCCCAGLGMGDHVRQGTGAAYTLQLASGPDGGLLQGREAWNHHYAPVKIVEKDGRRVETGGWNAQGLADMLEGFVEGGANFLRALGLPLKLGVALVAVLVASFAATTLDTATRLQRYVIAELAEAVGAPSLARPYAATALAVGLGLALALIPGPRGPGSGGLILWPLFGAINQLLAGLAFLVIGFYLWRKRLPVWFLAPPFALMVVMPTWAMLWQMFNPASGWWPTGNSLLFCFGAVITLLQFWLLWEGALAWQRTRREG